MRKLLLLGFAFAAILLSCEKGTTVCEETRKSSCLALDFPDSVKVNETFTLDVQYIVENSCGEFDSYEAVENDDITQITMWSKYQGCNCNLQFEEHEAQFEILIGQIGTYEYQFWVAENEWETYSLKVYE